LNRHADIFKSYLRLCTQIVRAINYHLQSVIVEFIDDED
jgi:hypothetical protein